MRGLAAHSGSMRLAIAVAADEFVQDGNWKRVAEVDTDFTFPIPSNPTFKAVNVRDADRHIGADADGMGQHDPAAELGDVPNGAHLRIELDRRDRPSPCDGDAIRFALFLRQPGWISGAWFRRHGPDHIQ